MAITEKITLLGKGYYKDIPDVLTLKSIPTSSELDYVSAEDFQQTMLEKILPQAVEEQINFKNLLDIDYQWICRCLRLLNYGPYHTTNAIFCPKCGAVQGEYRVNLENVECKPLPENFTNDFVISRDEFIDFTDDVHVHLLTVGEIRKLEADKMFIDSSGERNDELAYLCYMITQIGTRNRLTSVDTRSFILDTLTPADYRVLKEVARNITDFGLRVGGVCACPKCGSTDSRFFALVDEKFFRPTLGDLREWKNSRSARKDDDIQ